MKLPSNQQFTLVARSTRYDWDKARIMNYAAKKGLNFHQAVWEIVRKPERLREGYIDAVVDAQYHSSKRPQMEGVPA